MKRQRGTFKTGSREQGDANTGRKGKHISYSGRRDKDSFQLFGSIMKKELGVLAILYYCCVRIFQMCECKLIGPGCLFTRTLDVSLAFC